MLSLRPFHTGGVSIVFGKQNYVVFVLTKDAAKCWNSMSSVCVLGILGQSITAEPRSYSFSLSQLFASPEVHGNALLSPRDTSISLLSHAIPSSPFSPQGHLGQSTLCHIPHLSLPQFFRWFLWLLRLQVFPSLDFSPLLCCTTFSNKDVTLQSSCMSENVSVAPSHVSLAGYRILG